MLKIVKGVVKSDVSPNEDGSFWVETDSSEVARVAYTSPSYNSNQGGLFAPPTIDQEVLLFENPSPQDNSPEYFYIATIVDDQPLNKTERIPEFKGVRANGTAGESAYGKDKRPVKMTLQNSDGQGISTTSNLSNQKRENYTSLDAETGSVVGAGEQGCFAMNEHLDGIVVQGEPNGLFPTRSITMTSDGPQFMESGASINLSVAQKGDDVNISNCANTPGLGGCGVAAGNVRIHSKNRDIILRTGAPDALANGEATKNINIITPTAQIQVNGVTGDISIQSLNGGSINMEGSNAINLTAPNISLNGNLTMTGGALTVDGNTGTVAHAGASFNVNAASVNVLGGTTKIEGGNDYILNGPAQSYKPADKFHNKINIGSTGSTSPTAPAPQSPVPPNITPNTYGDAPD